jgi:hypothetical protein
MINVTCWVTFGVLPLLATTVKLNVPVAVGVPLNTPVLDRLRPGGSVLPLCSEKVGVGTPVALKVWL